jgi:ankyrin repeat protein
MMAGKLERENRTQRNANLLYARAHRTALHVAAAVGDLEACKLLIEAGADWESHDAWGVMPIQDALRVGHGRVVVYLQSLMLQGYVCDSSLYNVS